MDTCRHEGPTPGPQELIDDARRLCEERNQRFTPSRQQVFEIIARADGPVTAYEILDSLLGSGIEAAPPTVYRALEFLQHQSLVHRLETLNAFVACEQPRVHHSCQFLICTACGTTSEIDANGVMSRLSSAARVVGFTINEAMVELKGLCARCRTALLNFTSRGVTRRPTS
ncbi:MAG: transcriptional repressor [Betaproteobacteria bacterium]|nr:transcriptional repressor [Betaproteobacteria bacterium]